MFKGLNLNTLLVIGVGVIVGMIVYEKWVKGVV